MKEIDAPAGEGVRVNIGLQVVEIDKMFGPTGGCTVRVRVDETVSYWLFEQERCTAPVQLNHSCDTSEWIEIARVPLQPQEDNCYASLRLEHEAAKAKKP